MADLDVQKQEDVQKIELSGTKKKKKHTGG